MKRLSRTLTAPDRAASLDRTAPLLKAHLRDGRVLVLGEWSADPVARTVSGRGDALDVNRSIIAQGSFTVPLDSVALFETNVVQTSSSVAALTVVTVASLALTAYCIANPKACFGSCPTFYISDGTHLQLQAEGFSSSILPSLEATDVDALYRVAEPKGELEVRMRNEALETHVVRHVELLAVPRAMDERVFATAAGEFLRGRLTAPPSRCAGPEGDCRAALLAFDGVERLSLADSTDLAARERIELEFSDVEDGPLGLVLARRQTLLTTYLYYQALAYMGRSAGHWLATLERGGGDLPMRTDGIGRALGGIEVFVRSEDGTWLRAGEDTETGPLAADVRVLPLPRVAGKPLHVRLQMARGLWRLDWVALARLSGSAAPIRLRPVVVERAGPNAAGTVARDGALTTQPGDEYIFRFRLPAAGRPHELFLETRGYYLEWMRDAWLAEENPQRAAMMLAQPAEALRVLAPEFKAQEAGMERTFWGSRYAHP
ncbi:MAG TPA: hypothetical protein VJY35_01415 [Candidatus Eisenbacteria bacterium]|nr:hypothetical protein [Candidatus Eisenbacteria bacterium]